MRVVKIGGRAQADPRLFPLLGEAWNDSPTSLCVVHGGGDEVSAMQRGSWPRNSIRRRPSGYVEERSRPAADGAVGRREQEAGEWPGRGRSLRGRPIG